ncbi:MAG TPA: YbhB/YbcL family Raf kinase inhibitor-like protein [Polyangiaceae bacterium]
MSRRLFAASVAAAVSLLALGATTASSEAAPRMTLTSADFTNDQAIPAQFSCEGPGLSPSLSWSNVPSGTQSLALVVRDPDAPGGNFVHWVLYEIPPNVTGLPRGAASQGALPQGAQQGMNGKNDPGWTPPCPPSGTHHYHFELYALDNKAIPTASPTDTALTTAMRGHVLAKAELIGTYKKAK